VTWETPDSKSEFSYFSLPDVATCTHAPLIHFFTERQIFIFRKCMWIPSKSYPYLLKGCQFLWHISLVL